MLKIKNSLQFLFFFLIIRTFTKSQIVQPSYDLSKEKTPVKKVDVIVTRDKLDEVTALREEIQEDVAEGIYKIGRPNEDKIVKKANQFLKLRNRLRTVLRHPSSVTLDFEEEQNEIEETEKNNDFSHDLTELSSIWKNDFNSNQTEFSTNIIESSIFIDNSEKDMIVDRIRNIKVNFGNSKQRETLVLKAIIENMNFTHGFGVHEWKIIEHAHNKILVGRENTEVIILKKQKNQSEWKQTLSCHIESKISSIEVFSQWNSTQEEFENFVLITFFNKVLWLSVNDCRRVWEWNVGKPIISIKSFQINENGNFLFVLTDKSSEIGYTSLNIYQFLFLKKEFWITQMIPLQNYCSEITILDSGCDVILGIPQKDSALIFTYNLETSNDSQFKKVFEIQSEQLESISAFQMGGISYVAIGGKTPVILRYHHGKFIPQTILGQSFGIVEKFLPIPARTYRDDLILLIQHKIIYESHSLTVLEALIWDSEAFEISFSVPCQSGDVIFDDVGVNCLIDYQRIDGIKGTVVFSLDQRKIGLVIPRVEAPSGFFELETELVERKSEYEELERIHGELMDVVKQYDSLIAEAQSILAGSLNNNMDNRSNLELDSLVAPELHFSGGIDKIFVDDIEWTEEDSKIELSELVDLIEEINSYFDQIKDDQSLYDIDPRVELLENVTRARRHIKHENLIYEKLSVENLFIENMNGIPVGDILFFKGNELNYNGSVIIHSENMKLMYESENNKHNLIRTDYFKIDGSLNVENINNIEWLDFINETIETNVQNNIENLKVEGNIYALNNISIDSLNDLKFPEDFLWSSGPGTSIIRSEKIFHSTLNSNSIDTGGLINGIDPFKLITLSEDQFVSGITTFTQLEVTENLEVNGTIRGKNLEEYLSNPNLLHSNFIEAEECIFNKLQVEGPIIVKGNINGMNLNSLLEDVVYKTDQKIVISGTKTFRNLEFREPITVLENSLYYGISLDEIMTKNTDQELGITRLNGDILFNDLQLNGLFSSVNIKELEKNSVKINQNLIHTGSTLIVGNDSEIYANQIQVTKNLNDNPVGNYRTIYEDLYLVEAKFNDLHVDNLVSDCDIMGEGYINDENIMELKTEQYSILRNKKNAEELILQEAVFEDNVTVNSINLKDANELISTLKKLENLPEKILSGEIQVDGIIVNGNVDVHVLNGKRFDEEILSQVVWLNSSNIIKANVHFLDSVIAKNDILIEEYLNGFHFPTFIDDIVFKGNGEKLIVTGTKTFNKPVRVMEDVKVDYINNIRFNAIVLKNRPFTVQSQINIFGNMYVKNLEVDENINDFHTRNLRKLSSYDTDLKAHIFDEMIFKEQMNVENLILKGSYNDTRDINGFLNNVVYKNYSGNIFGEKIFQSELIFDDRLNIESLNEMNLTWFFDNSIVNSSPNNKIEISGPVTFLDRVHAKFIKVNKLIKTSNLMGCELNEWLKNGLRIDLPLRVEGPMFFTPEALEENNLNVVYANKFPMLDIITLHTEQNISGSILFSDVQHSGNIHVDGLVNNVDIKMERGNTLMIYGDQHVTAPTTIQSLRVLKNLETHAPVNGKDIRDVAISKDNLALHSPIVFKKIVVKNVVTNDFISGIDFKEWSQKVINNNTEKFQKVFGNWIIDDLYVRNDVIRNKSINDVGIESDFGQIKIADSEFVNNVNRLKTEFLEQCRILDKTICKTSDKGYYLKYFTDSFVLSEKDSITYLDHFKHDNDNFLLVNAQCYSSIYRWNSARGKFEKIQVLETGMIDDIVKASLDVNSSYIITNLFRETNIYCNKFGANAWLINHNGLKHYGVIGEPGVYSMIRENSGRLYLLNEINNRVTETNIDLTTNSSWELPINSNDETHTYRFLPEETNLGVALSNGKRIVIINPQSEHQEMLNRRKRRFLDTNHKTISNEKLTNVTVLECQKRSKKIIDDVIAGLVHEFELIKMSEFKARNLDDSSSSSVSNKNSSRDYEKVEKILKEVQKFRKIFNKTSNNDDNDFNDTKAEKLEELNIQKFRMPLKTVQRTAISVITKLWEGMKRSKNVQDIVKRTKNIHEKFKLVLKNHQIINHNDDKKNDDYDDYDIRINRNNNVDNIIKNETMIKTYYDYYQLSELEANNDRMLDIMSDGIESVAKIVKLKPNNNSSHNYNEDVIAEVALINLKNKVLYIIEKLQLQKTKISNIGSITNGTNTPSQNYGNKTDRNSKKIITDDSVTSDDSFNFSFDDILQQGHKMGKKLFEYFISYSNDSNNDVNVTILSKNDHDHYYQEETTTKYEMNIENENHKLISSLSYNESSNNVMNEPVIGLEIPESRFILSADNSYLPSRQSGEVLGLKVGSKQNRLDLIAVSETIDHVIKNKHDMIRIYKDIFEGNLFQSIATYKPHSLTALYIGDETILAFIEDQYLIKLFLYRGIQGFIEYASFSLNEQIEKLISISFDGRLNDDRDICLKHYLVVVMKNKMRFYEAIMSYNCLDIKNEFNCEDW